MRSLFLLLAFSLFGASCHSAQESASKEKSMATSPATSATNNTSSDSTQTQIATLGGGCFWCIEAVYLELNGVLKVESGYSGGHVANPTYKAVTTGTTGHAEVAQITFDPSVVSFEEILEVFFTVHDPTTLNRQGNDVGTQYRSAIFYHSPEQKKIAEAAKTAAAELWDDPVVTEIAALDKFYKAEEYHQNYYKENPYQPYCVYVVGPKVKKFREQFKAKLKQ
ncbi:MAG: peptide-methionine (S)-S-oxide reductase MsrA [Saprospiraceae bacterium]|nr:peptide-methionine (S)-S-oxide reductase MsrA [Lewinellaceae bacterium]